jgi:cell division protein ZapA
MMAHVDVTVNGRKYKMGCRAGEELRVKELAANIDAIVQGFKSSSKIIPDDRLFLMAAIMLADQLKEAQDELTRSLKILSDARSYHVIDGGHGTAPHVTRVGETANPKTNGQLVR